MNTEKKIRVVLWDIDNTLVDTSAAERVALKQGFREFRLGECTEEMYLAFADINLSHWERLERGEITREEVLLGRFRDFFNQYGIRVEPLAMFNARYQKTVGDHVRLFDHAEEVVRALKGRLLQCVTTNGTRDAQKRKIRNIGLADCFDGIFISEDVGAEKPQSEFFRIVLREAGRRLSENGAVLSADTEDPGSALKNEEVMIIGDSLTSDMRGGNNAGILCCWFNPKEKRNDQGVHIDYEIRDLREVLEIVK